MGSKELSALEAKHRKETALEAGRDVLDSHRPCAIHRPPGGTLPESHAWLERFYAGGRFAREKKPGVYDHLRSWGPWMVSVDEEPLSVLDAMSQTATVVGGFAEDKVVEALINGHFSDVAGVAVDTTVPGETSGSAFAELLLSQLPAMKTVSFTNSGAEANEKALALCMAHRKDPGMRRVLAFEGSFHGRTWLCLHATFNPVKREPFELPGYETSFAPFPVWTSPNESQPEQPEGWIAAAATGRADAWESFKGRDPLLDSEIKSLEFVATTLAKKEHFAVMIEPMQSEGGDRYATHRYYRALRVLTRAMHVALVFDEVQTGFRLGRDFFWHTGFGLVDASGQPDAPDAVTVAKRAQVGVVLSTFDDPEPTHSHGASLVRGRLHAEMMLSDTAAAPAFEAQILPRIRKIAEDFPELVSAPRAFGYAFAFDVPSPTILSRYLKQRFWRGAVVFAAGSTTVRYRLSTAFTKAELDLLFSTIRATLTWLQRNPEKEPPAWQDIKAIDGTPPRDVNLRVRVSDPSERDAVLQQVLQLEAEVYEPARRDPRRKLANAFDEGGVVVLAELEEEDGTWRTIGSALACPLEAVGEVMGPDRDPNLGKQNTLYSLAITVAPAGRGLGLGFRLKAEQLRAARQVLLQGEPRYAYVTGRNRVGHTPVMRRINRRLGSHTCNVFTHQYNDPNGVAEYYRIPLRPVRVGLPSPAALRLDAGVGAPFARPAAGVSALDEAGLLAGPTHTKITICNYISPAIVRAVEYITAFRPQLPHLYLGSGRDELVDKALRTLRYSRKEATKAIGFEGGYLGHTTASARSLSDPATHSHGEGYFDWPLIPHPAEGLQETLDALDACVKQEGAQHVIGLFVELVQERRGTVLEPEAQQALKDYCGTHDIPLVFVESAAALDVAVAPAAQVVPDISIWWNGGQTGFVQLQKRYFIDKPLTMVSTWDGDELSLIRIQHQLAEVRQHGAAKRERWLDAMVELEGAGFDVSGRGYYWVLDAGERADEVLAALQRVGLKSRIYPGNHIPMAPAFDQIEAVAEALSLFVAAQNGGAP